MPILRRAGLVLLLSAIAAGCDSDDPLTVSSRTAQIFVAATGAVVQVYDVFEVYQDNAGDGPDDIDGDGEPDVYLFCQPRQVTLAPSVPWSFRIEVLVTSADGATTNRVTSAAAATNEQRNRTLYAQAFPPGSDPPSPGNPNQEPTGISPIPVPINQSGAQRLFHFRNPAQRWATDRLLIDSVTNPLHELRPVFFDGLCPGADILQVQGTLPGPAMIDLEPQPFTFTLNEGETVTVHANRATRDEQLAIDPGLVGLVLNEPQLQLEAALLVGGQRVIPQGTTQGPSISFTYTVR
jgi:hypothetical protein